MKAALFACFLMALVCGAVGVFGDSDSLRPFHRWLFLLLSVVLVAATVRLGTNLKRWKRQEALIVSGKGIQVGIGPRDAFLVPWPSLARVSVTDKRPGGKSMPILAIEVADPGLEAQHVDWMTRACAALTGQPALSLGLTLLDRSGEEIFAAMGRLCPKRYRSFMVRENPAPTVTMAVTMDSKRLAGTYNGTLITIDDYKEVFRNGPLGVWDSATFGVSPADTLCAFCADGTGIISSGASGMLGYSTDIWWRSTGEHRIRVGEEGSEGCPVRYEFIDQTEGIKIEFFLDDAEDTEDVDWPDGLLMESMKYSGPCRKDRVKLN